MNDDIMTDVAEVLLAASLPIDPVVIHDAATAVIEYYANAPSGISLPEEEVSDRISELWELWIAEGGIPSTELPDVFAAAIGADATFERLSREYFSLVEKLETSVYMPRNYAVALIGSSPLIRTLVVEQHLGLDRIRTILNVPGATYDAIRTVLRSIGITEAFNVNDIEAIHAADIADVDKYFGDSDPDDAAESLKGLLSNFAHGNELWEEVMELVYIGYEPYLFMLYYELLTLESTDRLPGRGIYECTPRSEAVKRLWAEMYTPVPRDPYLNNAKSVYALDLSWAETKYSRETQNGAIMLADVFDIMSELPYPTRRQIAHVIRCYIVLAADKSQVRTPLADVTSNEIALFVETVSKENSQTKGVLDQRLVDYITMCAHDYDEWVPRGQGSPVNETNASGRKYGDVEYLDLPTRTTIHAFEAHGGGLRDEYIQDHIRTLHITVEHHLAEAENRGEEYKRDVQVTFVAHDISRLVRYKNGHTETISGIPFTFRFITFEQLVEEAGGIEAVTSQIQWFDELVHRRISRLPDAYALKKRYCEIIAR